MQSLATRYRPKTLEEVCSQTSIIKILKKQIQTGQIKNCYLFCGPSGCVDSDTEFFTGTQWKKISDYKYGDKVLVFDPSDRYAHLEIPEKYIKLSNYDEFNHFKTRSGIDIVATYDHTMVYEESNGSINTKSCFEVADLYNKKQFNGKFLTTFNYSGEGIDLTDAEIKLMCAVICAGSFLHSGYAKEACFITLTNETKINKLRDILKESGYSYTESVLKNGYVRFYFNAPRVEEVFTSFWYDCNNRQLSLICDCVLDWCENNNKDSLKFDSWQRDTVNFLQFAFTSCGKRAVIKLCKDGNKGSYYRLRIKSRDKLVLSKKSKSSVITKVKSPDMYKYCFVVSTHMWVMRRNGRIFITGNCGKTTIARILAYLINEGKGEPIEIDAASNNSVDNVRNLIDQAHERAIGCKYKIFIIDESHALTNQAYQAFLKTIEEPPPFTIFIFCTTDPQKMPATIINRVQRFNLTKIETNVIADRLKYICKSEGIVFSDEAIDFIAKISDGGMRDAIANLEKVSDYGDVNIDNALECLGSYSYSMFFDLVNSLIDGRDESVLNIVNTVYNQGSDLKLFVGQFLSFCLDVSKYLIFGNCNLLKIPSTMENDLKNATNIEGAKDYYMYLVDKLLDLKMMLKNDTNIKDTIEVCLLRICRYIK